MPEIAFLMGKSSSGKDNIFKALVGDKELNLKTVIMYTTRPMRAGEKDDGQIRLGSGDKYIVIGTIEAYNKFCAYFGKDAILPIYIEVDDGIRLMRAINREQKQEVPQYEEMCRRFLADQNDFSEEKIKEAGINQRFSNDGTIEDCIRDIKEAIKQQLL